MRSIARSVLGLIAMVVVFNSCQSIANNPYPLIEVKTVFNRNLYLMCSDKSELIIFIDGSGMNSVLGINEGGHWKSVEFPYFITNAYKNTYDIVIPEKLDFKLGEDCARSREKILNYTVEGLVTAYTQTIDCYLDGKKNNKVILFGISEGGLLLPKIFNDLQNKDAIKKMVIWGAGGYSQYDCFKIIANSSVPIPKGYKSECSRIDQVNEDLKKDPQSMSKYYLGWPYNRWSSFFSYQPIHEYETINIPILFVQGLYDYSSPVESVEYIQDQYKSKQYKYLYYKMGHIPNSDKEIKKILSDINSWIKE